MNRSLLSSRGQLILYRITIFSEGKSSSSSEQMTVFYNSTTDRFLIDVLIVLPCIWSLTPVESLAIVQCVYIYATYRYICIHINKQELCKWVDFICINFMVHSQVLTIGLVQFSCKYSKYSSMWGTNKTPFHKLQKKVHKKIRAILHSNLYIYISTIHLMKSTKYSRSSKSRSCKHNTSC